MGDRSDGHAVLYIGKHLSSERNTCGDKESVRRATVGAMAIFSHCWLVLCDGEVPSNSRLNEVTLTRLRGLTLGIHAVRVLTSRRYLDRP